jgi:branched-chain amino acid transport system substrate-binding protein
MRRGQLPALGLVMTLALGLSACGNAVNTVSHAGNSDGVTATSITVGSIASLSGPIPADFAPVIEGVEAYFDMVNANGGVYGRQILLPAGDQLDDASDPSQDLLRAKQLVDDGVFAIVGVATPEFAAASYLVQNDVPAFGYAISPDWSEGDNLFGAEGSYVDFSTPGPEPAFIAQRVGAQRVGLVSYSGVPESSGACNGFAGVLRRYGITVSDNLTIPAPAIDLTAQAIRMKAAGVQLVISCMDLGGNVLLAQALQQEQMHVDQYWLNGYDEGTLKQYTSLMQGIYFLIPHTPFQLPPGQLARYPGMQLYLTELARYFPQDTPSEVSLAGWIAATTFVTGLEKLGPHVTPTRSALIAALNGMVDYTADGLVSPITWRDEHDANGPFDCNVYVRVEGDSFVPVFGSPPSVFTCFRYPEPQSTRTLVPIAPPTPVPGS